MSSLTLYEVLVIIAGLINRSLKDRVFMEEVINSIISLKGLVIDHSSLKILSEH